VDAATALAPIKRSELGLNMNPFVDLSDARLVPALRQLNASILRFPSGFADGYHWQTNTDCVYTPHPASTFDVFMKNVAGPLGADVVIGVNYGSNASCNGPGDPAEAAAWVDAANNHNKYGPSCWANTTR
jgi:alpha-L-arabinofuranosidase